MSCLLQRVAACIGERQLFRRGQPILVAVSGGVDSMVLLRLLHELSAQERWRLTVAHFNHQLRGRNSDADERLVRQRAVELGLPFVGGGADVRGHAVAHKLSLEMAARKLRHGFLARTARRLGIPAVALAHHADDQTELFFLRVLRGAGGEGLAGMKWRSASPADREIELVRPLLDQAKADLQEYARQGRVWFREDASNARVALARNRVRHELLPLLRKYQPALARTIPRLMEIIGRESEFVAEAARRWMGRKRRGAFGRLAVAGQQRQCVQTQLRALGVAEGFDLIEQLRLVSNRPVTIGPQLEVWRDALGFVRTRRVPAKAPANSKQQFVKLDLPNGSGEVVFDGVKVHWVRTARSGERHRRRAACEECFDADKLGQRVLLRHWQPGDRFQPIGMAAGAKLQDLFTNLKIPREQRRHLVVGVAADGRVFWVEGLRIGERFKLDKQTVRQLNWRWARES